MLQICTFVMMVTAASAAGVTSSTVSTNVGQRQQRQVLLDGLKNGCASGLATICCKTLLQPFDTLKTVQQASTTKVGLLAAAQRIVSERGFGGLYRGLPIALVGSVPAMSTYWAAYQTFKGVLAEFAPNAPMLLIVALSSAIANSVAGALRVPCEVVKQQLQAGIHPNFWVAVRTLGASGFKGFYVPGALMSQLARDIPFGVLTLCTFEAFGAGANMPDLVARVLNPSGTMWRAICFGIATSLATIATNPMDVLKTRVMTQRAAGIGNGWIALTMQIWAAEGGGVFFKGALPRLLHKLPASTVFWLLYEAFRTLLQVQAPPKQKKSKSAS